MRLLLSLTLALALVSAAAAHDLGSQQPVKPDVQYPQNSPSAVLQGGDTIVDAVVIALPYSGGGTTNGFNDDYDEECPYTQSTSPDVVYTVTPDVDAAVDIDLLGSLYDTKLYVYDADLALVACNDDFHPDYTSKLEDVALMAGVQYYIVIDGYGGAAGDYVIDIAGYQPCVVDCPVGAELEGEPPLVDGYVDEYNSGCGAPAGVLLQPFDSGLFCGVSGWYLGADGSNFRDTDWFTVTIPAEGVLEITGDAEQATYLFELGPQDCNEVAVLQQVTVGPCAEDVLVLTGVPGNVVWIWVGPTTFEGPVNEYDYVLYSYVEIATENHSWTDVKAMFN